MVSGVGCLASLLPISIELGRVAGVGLGVLLAVKLVRQGLLQPLRYFRVFIIFQSLASVIFLITANSSEQLRGYLSLGFVPVSWLLSFLVVFELSVEILQRHGGLQGASRRFLRWAFIVSVLVALGSAYFEPESVHRSTEFLILFWRLLTFSLSIYLVLLGGLLVYFPFLLPRNLLTHAFIFSIYFLASSALLLARNWVGPGFGGWINLVNVLIENGCFLSWLLLLRPEGEHVETRTRSVPEWQEQYLLAQLDAINAAVSRLGARRLF